MNINRLILHTRDLQAQTAFYHTKLGFTIVSQLENQCTFQAGLTELVFISASPDEFRPYHFAFNVTEDGFPRAEQWLLERDIRPIVKDEQTRHVFTEWNAEAIYFHDPDGNILEFITRHNLASRSGHDTFQTADILCISEAGIVVEDPVDFTIQFRKRTGIGIWREAGADFKAVGGEDGLLIAVTSNRIWFPTQIPAGPLPMTLYSKDINQSFSYGPYLFNQA